MKYGLTLSLLLFSACASVHPGHESIRDAVSDELGLKISARKIDDDANDSFSLVEVTLENQNDEWVKVASAEIPIDQPASSKVSVVVGKDLVDWADAVAERDKLQKHNRAVVESIAMIGGATAIAVSGNRPNVGNTLGAVVYTGAFGFYLTDIFSNGRRRAESPGTLPDHHLYTPFSIPGRLFTRKWLVLNRPVGTTVSTLGMNLETVDGKKAHYTVKF